MKLKNIQIIGMNNTSEKIIDLQNFVYFYGPNGAGKSTILQAVELALLGYIPGEDKRSSSIFKHAKNNTISVKLTFDNDSSVTRIYTGIKNKITSAVETDPEDLDLNSIISSVELPIFNFTDFMNLSANKMKEWFLTFLPSNKKDEIDWRSEITTYLKSSNVEPLSSSQLEDYVSAIKSSHSSGMKEVQLANAFFKDQLSRANKDLARATSTLQSMTIMDDTDYVESEDKLQTKFAALQQEKSAYIKYSQQVENNKKIDSIIDKFESAGITGNIENNKNYIAAKSEFQHCTDKLSTIKITDPDEEHKLSTLKNQLSEDSARISLLNRIITSGTTCPIIKDKICKDLIEYSALCKKDLNETNSHMEHISRKIKELENSKLNRRRFHDELTSKINSAQSTIHNIESLYAQKHQYESMIVEIPESAPKERDFDTLINDVVIRINKVHEAAKSKEYSEMIRKSITSYRTEVIQLKSLVKLTSASELQSRIADESNPFDSLIVPMNNYFESFGKKIETLGSVYFNNESKVNSFEFGVIRSGNKIPYALLSSGEKCIFALSLLMSMSRISNSALKVVIIDDAFDHLDDETFVKVISNLSEIANDNSVQVITAGVRAANGSFTKKV